MGWGSAGQIFDPVARALIDAGATDQMIGDVCFTLAKQLRDGDWDTVDESIDEFRGHPVVVTALQKASGWHNVDDYGTAVIDYEEATDEWILTVDKQEAGRAPGTAEGHDRLVCQWFASGEDTEERREEMNRALITSEETSA